MTKETILKEEILSILKEAYSREDLGEEWAVAELSSLFSLRGDTLLTEIEREVGELPTYFVGTHPVDNLKNIEKVVLLQQVKEIIDRYKK